MHLGVKGKAPPSSKVIRRLCRGQPPSSTRPLAFVSAADATSFARATVVLSKPHPAVTPNFKQTAPKKGPCGPVSPSIHVNWCSLATPRPIRVASVSARARQQQQTNNVACAWLSSTLPSWTLQIRLSLVASLHRTTHGAQQHPVLGEVL